MNAIHSDQTEREREREAAAFVSQAIGEIDAIVAAAGQTYADPDKHPFNARRKFTLKDARSKARNAARLLRQAWDILDPSLK